MKITNIDINPIEYYPCKRTGHRLDFEGKRIPDDMNIPVYKGFISGLPSTIDALIVASDLQFTEFKNDKPELVGLFVPEFLQTLIRLQIPEIKPEATGVVLCGDFYSTLEKMGGVGDVRQIWLNFREHFKWVVGVAGNHDDFGSKVELNKFKKISGIHYIEKEIIELDNLKIAGQKGIIGDNNKPHRMNEVEYLKTLGELARQKPDFILLHESPDYPENKCIGNSTIRELLERSPENLAFCGHRHWKNSLQKLKNGTQVLNVDSKIFILINNRFET